ncbi:hypothetical protein CAC42_5315 [Sphaceloma murrayae]|uniref:Uncharacterized protein n=1 Tax=Sphaceloma murrayae TaxID=2082308 RepID=A0A2K1QUN1_9PEZI|nr:hypothetical protein CAC42_5315 [Sphaceloma murrayae]
MHQFQGNQGHRALGGQQYGPPPSKKHKTGNGPIVTYYPPPPGYVPPPNAQLPQTGWHAGQHQPAGWTPQQQAYYQQYYQQYPQAAAPGYGYAANGWQQPQGYYPGQPAPVPTQQYPGNVHGVPGQYQNQYYNQQGYQWPSQSPQNAPTATSPQNSASDTSQGFAKPVAPASASYGPHDRNSRAVSTTTSNAEESAVTDEEYTPAHEFDETDYCREASFVKDGDSIQQELSLGTIVYYPARPSRTALASTFQDAELELLMPKAQESQGEDESQCVSKYFIASEAEKVGLSVRQIDDEWEEAKDDIIFDEFVPANSAQYLPLYQVVADRHRPDVNPGSRYPPVQQTVPTVVPPPAPAPTLPDPQASGNVEADNEEDEGVAMDLSSDNEAGPSPEAAATTDAQSRDVDKDDEAKPSSRDGDAKADLASLAENIVSNDDIQTHKRNHSPRSRGYKRAFGSDSPRNRPRSREHYQRGMDRGRPGSGDYYRGPVGPPPPPPGHGRYRDRQWSGDSRMQYGPYHAPPPPETQDFDNPWRNPATFERRGSTGSNTSQRTVPGGDFDELNGNSQTAKADSTNVQSDVGRKRGFDEMDRNNRQHYRGARQDDDHRPRPRGFRQKIPDAYR